MGGCMEKVEECVVFVLVQVSAKVLFVKTVQC